MPLTKVNALLGTLVALASGEDGTGLAFTLLHDPHISPVPVLPQVLIS